MRHPLSKRTQDARAKILARLAQGSATALELAALTGETDDRVRTHLRELERRKLVAIVKVVRRRTARFHWGLAPELAPALAP